MLLPPVLVAILCLDLLSHLASHLSCNVADPPPNQPSIAHFHCFHGKLDPRETVRSPGSKHSPGKELYVPFRYVGLERGEILNQYRVLGQSVNVPRPMVDVDGAAHANVFGLVGDGGRNFG